MNTIGNSTKETVITCLQQNLTYLKAQYHVKRIGLFGSFATETATATATSDVDLLVEFDRPIGLKFVELCDYLESCLGRKVDILTLAGIASIRNQDVADRITRSLIDV